MRKIIHIDMDAFFASVEQRDHPELRGKPIAIGMDTERGVVATASYEARPFGVHSAMSVQVAKRRCPQLILVPGHYQIYKEVSALMHDIFHEYTDLVEPLSLDEAFLDVTENKPGMKWAVDIAKEIKQKIRERLQLTASAGVSYCKFLAKIASDWRKPDGLYTIHPDQALDFIARLPVERFWGVGPKTAKLMHRVGIRTGADLRRRSLEELSHWFGKMGTVYYQFARGIDERQVETNRTRKSVGCERTYEHDLIRSSAFIIEIYHLTLELVDRLKNSGFEGLTLTLKVKYNDFTQLSKSVTKKDALLTKEQILPLAKSLLKELDLNKPVRLLGLAISHPKGEERQPQWIIQELPFKD